MSFLKLSGALENLTQADFLPEDVDSSPVYSTGDMAVSSEQGRICRSWEGEILLKKAVAGNSQGRRGWKLVTSHGATNTPSLAVVLQ